MPRFEYQALDTTSQQVRGEIDANTPNEALGLLAQRGLKVQKLRSGGSTATPPAPVQSVSPTRQATQPARPSLSRETVRTKPSQYKDVSLFFIQLENMLRAGIAIPKALDTLSQRRGSTDMARAAREMSRAVGEGRPFSEEMARFPDLFSPGVVGAVAAGEKGGYLAEACALVGEQNAQAQKFNRFFWWAWLAAINCILIFFVTTLFSGVVERGIDYINGKDQQGTVVSGGLTDRLFSPFGILLVLLIILYCVWLWASKQSFTRPFRHSMATKFPILKKRTAGENLMLFSWHLSQLSKAGLSPWVSYTMAAKALPNITVSEQMLAEGGQLRDNAQFSAILAQSRFMPYELAGLIQTGEITGRLPEALDQASELSKAEAKEAENYFKLRMGCWGSIIVIGGGLLGFMVIYGTYLRGIFRILE